MKEFVVKTIMELIDMANNGIISFVVTVAATRYMTKDKTDVCRIKERANVSQTSAHDDISESHNKNLSEISKKIDIHDTVNCNFHFHECTDPEKDQ